jgi:hypothetical protein
MKLNWLLVFIPVAIALRAFGANPILVFAVQANGCRTDTYSFLRPSPQRGATR